MPIARPFRAIRPAKDKVHLVVSRSYIGYDHDELTHKLDHNPYSFVHVINPDHGHEDMAPHGSHEFFEKVREKYLEFYGKDYFVQDEKPQFYVYRQSAEGKEFTGVICATASLDYEEDKIKKHEHTLTKREKMFTDYLSVTGINAEPVLLTYPDSPAVDQVVQGAVKEDPFYDFTTHDTFRHTLWGISDPEEVKALEMAFAEMDSFYIADGHHRSASSARLTREENGGVCRTESAHDFFMSYLVPASSMHIEAFHRVLHLEGSVEKLEVLDKLRKTFQVEHLEGPAMPHTHGEMCISFHGDWYRLNPNQKQADKLDVELCSEMILEPIFGIEDLRNDKRISFLSGDSGLKGVKKEMAKEGRDVIILLYPIQVEEIFAVSDKGESMPPKSTWVEPKLRSALTIYDLKAH